MGVKVINFRDKAHIYYSNDGNVLRISTGVRWLERFEGVNHVKITGMKKNIESILNDYIFKHQEDPPVSYIKEVLKKGIVDRSLRISPVFQMYMDSLRGVRPQTLKQYHSTLFTFNEYQKHYDITVTLKDINVKWVEKFRYFLSEQRKMNRSTINRRMKTFKQFIRWCIEEDIYQFHPTLLSFKALKREKSDNIIDSKHIALSIDEIRSIKDLELSGLQEVIRDEFIILCLTGLRISDLYDLRKHHIQKNGDIEVITKGNIKTGHNIKIPVTDDMKYYLQKYEYKFPVISNPVFNRYIKSICSRVESLHSDVFIEIEKYEKVERRFVKKYTLVTAHTGRRSFITNCILNDIPLTTIMEFTSHQKLDQLISYKKSLEGYRDDVIKKVNLLG